MFHLYLSISIKLPHNGTLYHGDFKSFIFLNAIYAVFSTDRNHPKNSPKTFKMPIAFAKIQNLEKLKTLGSCANADMYRQTDRRSQSENSSFHTMILIM